MGSAATLDIGNLCIDYCKNWLNDHSDLFLKTDLATAEYHYVGDDRQPIVEGREAYVAPLGAVLPRIELLGTTLERLRRDYARCEATLPFDLLLQVFQLFDVGPKSPPRDFWGDFDHSIARELDACLTQIVGPTQAAEYRGDWSTLFENLDPHTILRLLGENPYNANASLIWRFADLVDGGYVEPGDVYHTLPNQSSYLIVTEGSTDTHILKKAFALRRPRVADFFCFVDMKENYPFTGTGNLFNFSKGLARIGIVNRVIVLYDNDAEAQAKLRATASLDLPVNIRALGLPTLPEFENFPTIGPSGRQFANINQAAASIECYLDHTWAVTETPAVRWTNYQPQVDSYQGALIDKERYTKAFLELRDHEHDRYDFHKLDVVLDTIIAEAVSIAESWGYS
jgi:hypothetical protein